jgi:hypothetical protein
MTISKHVSGCYCESCPIMKRMRAEEEALALLLKAQSEHGLDWRPWVGAWDSLDLLTVIHKYLGRYASAVLRLVGCVA